MINLKMNREEFNSLQDSLGFAFSQGDNDAAVLKEKFAESVKPENTPEPIVVEHFDGNINRARMTEAEFRKAAEHKNYFGFRDGYQGIVIPWSAIKCITIGV